MKTKNEYHWLLIGFVTILSFMNAAYANIQASHTSSQVKFSGEHAGIKFDGIFKRWQANLSLPPTDAPQINATFAMNEAKTGDSIYDSTLQEFDWFDVENHGQGTFVSTQISVTENGYQVTGNLTLKNITEPVSFMLIEKSNSLTATLKINRLAFNIGTESDPDAEWVSKYITISMYIKK